MGVDRGNVFGDELGYTLYGGLKRKKNDYSRRQLMELYTIMVTPYFVSLAYMPARRCHLSCYQRCAHNIPSREIHIYSLFVVPNTLGLEPSQTDNRKKLTGVGSRRCFEEGG
jgi:hypothetical protein